MSQQNRIGELNDAAWNEAAEFVAVLAGHMGGPLSSDVLLDRMLAAMHRAGDAWLSDIKPTDITPSFRRSAAAGGARSPGTWLRSRRVTAVTFAP